MAFRTRVHARPLRIPRPKAPYTAADGLTTGGEARFKADSGAP